MIRYKQLAQKVVTDIQSNKLTDGEKMPSLRRFAHQHEVSVSTAVSCYEELVAQGWIQARPQSGFFISSKSSPIPSPVWESFVSQSTLAKRQIEKPNVNDGPLGTSRLELSETTSKSLERSVKRVMNRTNTQLMLYPDNRGEKPLRQALATHFSRLGYAINSQELLISHGCLDSVKIALTVCTNPGDTIAISSPCYNGLLDLISQLGLHIIEVPSHSDGIELDQLETLFQNAKVKAGLFCTTHMNPQGITMTMAQKKRLSDLANHYQIPVIEDDVYFELSHTNQHPLPAAYYDENGYVLWCGSFSKSLSPAYRVGWCRPGRYFEAYLKHLLGVPTLIQHALADFIDSGSYIKHLKQARFQLSANKNRYIKYLGHRLPQGSAITQPDGGLVLWIQIPGLNIDRVRQATERNNLDIRTGDIFTESDRYQNCIRINMGYLFNDKIESELEKLVCIVKQCCEEK
ncbi:PLP-dependent aminotransferase family protein [Vibrio viridaestus]|uniref:PLP-dependent aminotransferase family protein n=1 Tax=Vibrio viridaestus TaxID=2487322 RepID=A0A3N9TJB7_9VIBR|nr:PLP-dependent aminotransferase family protein [Vibrio viridaestus]RQW64458.1 PLP-dependent aminotransferase family protein [Vibrio viridaestus]